MFKIKPAFFLLCMLLVPTAASADSLTCALLPSLCEQGDAGGGATSVPELDANTAGVAGALVIGAALLMTSRRRRIA